ncbi:Carboxylesterase, type B [Beauveria brongniartii RCEF 3172]|uniref:Carboxylesterase, type B n=1 Tax=Beauveria brongniartii RCEF 3172 TaxID=1081107 RepID=A0A167AKS7_9HYPO|nr:Carboxylesterase, type B [Beauveria brongniartii RCEF 3172]
MGHSAGGISCYLHLLEAELGTKRPPFRKAGVLSGPVGGLDLTFLEKADRRWANLCRFWSVEVDSPADRLDFLRRLPTKDILGCVAELHWALFTLIVDEWTIRQSDLGCGVSVHLGETSGEPWESDDKVQLLISAADDEFKDFSLIANGDYAKFRSLLTSSYPSEAAAEEILETYGIFPTLSDEEFTEKFSQFVSDSTMMHKAYRGYKFFKSHREQQALLRGQDPKHLGLQYHYFEFGNPFLGPLRGTAHHGVELIYAFGNFYDALENADQGILQGYADPDQACVEADVGKLAVDMKSIEYQKSNIELSFELQDR